MNPSKKNGNGNSRNGGGGGLSRIPKLTFSFRRPKSGTNSVENSPEHSKKTTLARPSNKDLKAKSLPNSAESSPTLGRSKSLRLPRSSFSGLKSHSSSQLRERDQILDENDDFFPDEGQSSSSRGESSSTSVFSRGRSSTFSSSSGTKKGSVSSSRNGRSDSPGSGLTKSSGSHHRGDGGGGLRERDRFGFSSSSLRYSGSHSLSQAEDEPLSFTVPKTTTTTTKRGKLRSESFGAHDKIRPPTHANHPSKRSKTPTSLSTRNGNGGSGNGNGNDKLALKRASSLGKVGRFSTSSSASSQPQRSQTQSQKPPSTSSSIEQLRGKRPSSVVVTEDPADLNKIAHELSQPDSDNGSWDSQQLETKSVVGRSRTGPTTKQSHSLYGGGGNRSNTASPTERMRVESLASSGKHLAVRTRSSSIDKSHRPNSARSFYPGGKQKSDLQLSRKESDSSISELPRPRSVTNLESQSDHTPISGGPRSSAVTKRKNSSGGGRTSAPSSGRSTPVHRRTSSTGGGGSGVVGRGKDVTDGGVVSTPAGKAGSGLPPRTPYRVARVKQPLSSSGINELEGCVLLEADDYRRISNEVKFLKTALLKLKRELQGDLDDGTPSLSTATPSTRVGRSRATPSNATVSELNKKLRAMTGEKDKALEDVAKLKKEVKTKSTRIDSLSVELERTKKEKEDVSEEFKRMEAHRDHLLDKVERLHADKHNLEDRLNTLEKSRIYEQTMSESWLDELDGEDFNDDDDDGYVGVESSPRGKGGGERKETESDIGESPLSDGGEGENSEPESAAVCSAPVT